MAADASREKYYLELSRNPIRFEAVSKVTNVFFDDSNKQVFAVRSGGVTGVVVKGPTEETTTSFRMEDKGPVISIKFSPNQQVLAIQRTKTSVEFINFLGEMDSVEYSQSCKGKNTTILGFVWTYVNEIVFVTDHGVELFQVVPEKHTLKALKSYSLSVNWFVYCPQSCLVLLSSGTLGNQVQPLHFKQGSINKLNKLEIELPVIPKPPKLCLLARDVILAVLYGQPSIVVLRHQPRGVGSPGAEVVVYTIQKMLMAKKTHILRLDMSGRFAINVVDNLIVVHHQASKTSMLFDINMNGESDGFVSYHQPVANPRPIKPFSLRLPPATTTQVLNEPAQMSCDLYSPNWILFQPNIVIDAKIGCLWYVELNLEPLVELIPDRCLLVDFLMQRKDSKSVIIQVLQDILKPTEQNRAYLVVISELFDHLNDVYWSFLEVEMQSQMGTPASTGLSVSSAKPTVPAVPKASVVIDQADLYTNVFSKYADHSKEEETRGGGKFVVWVLLEYIRSLTDYHIPVQHYLHELVINSLVHYKAYYQLHQLLQYHVVSDSKPLACLLLSLENLYPAAHQLALDMLKRLSTANEEIIEVLLSKQQILSALRFVRSAGVADQVSSRKFLEAAKSCGDPAIFYAVFKFFESRNQRLKGSASFAKGEHCEVYVKHFQALFGESALAAGDLSAY
ncbi:regulator of MON1-CCZ1 complex-like [Schistocerca nitens]|uniref:regulator of MON1-CCZ1 complex-like n=1 Tax=Schistocerca nitens TaxID=7011 RepID=UPI0021198CF5|nr:regulator of MON1-CCZ1 complex-like [Schistocerca nitens]